MDSYTEQLKELCSQLTLNLSLLPWKYLDGYSHFTVILNSFLLNTILILPLIFLLFKKKICYNINRLNCKLQAGYPIKFSNFVSLNCGIVGAGIH